MENIFDFATKELSQDAFLSWFIANCNELEIGEYSYDFINLIGGFDFEFGDIKKVTIKQQEHNMDIVVDLWDVNNLHYVIVIEDKTSSSAHSGQLKRYAEIIDGWNTGEKDYENRRRKVFYKVDYLTEQDNSEIKEADKGRGENDKWRVFNLDIIHEFFFKIPKTSSEILNSYVEHIKRLHRDFHVVSNEPVKNWNYTNFQTFFKEEIVKEFSLSTKSFHFETWEYQGRLVSCAFYYHPQNKLLHKNTDDRYPSFAYPLLEFVFKKYAESIVLYTHISYHWIDTNNKDNSDRWTWKYSEYDPNKDDAVRFTTIVKDELKELSHIKIRKMGSDRDQTISTELISLESDNATIKKEILKKLELYFEAFKKADKHYKDK